MKEIIDFLDQGGNSMMYMLIAVLIDLAVAALFYFVLSAIWKKGKSVLIKESKSSRYAFNIGFGIITVVAGCFLVIFSIMNLVGFAMLDEASEHSKRVNLNETGDTVPMYAGETWDVDGQAQVTLKEIKLISGEDDTRYYEACFDYENISINGHKITGKVIENEMALSVYVDAADEALDNTVGWLSSNDEDFYYAVPGEQITDNRFRFVLEPEDAEKSKYVRISFTIYTTDEYEFYRQDFVQEI